ncbi:NADP-dependent oxidoreductase [Streptomyces samsunensis]|uniref:NADP-dependent oxidoreductase n=1 Tax=Streptomyces malaysiensis TaxID=92644 RepID=A0ABX6VWJ2_STRMQ|nr:MULTISPECIES: NADP-dependent oxidoreductase [Streptomyces]NUH41327.1 NADP-dependent oxidoreductase [Streptomyces samsunensis]QPI53743.1 NADP-dependent oxidoreductase [Streptomyces solisilvae]UHH15097.1 NADP-dependent oxidoreductase [Streptomyces sp. HNM0561]
MSEHTMRAVTIREFGGPEVLTAERVARPEPLPTEVLVRVHAAGINPVDWKTRAGQGMAGLQTLPMILGWDVSGVVEEVGFGVTTLAPGDEVYGMPWFPRAAGAYAEFVTAPSRHFARKPASVGHVEAASLPLAALTAWQALVDTAGVKAGQRVLVHAAAGGVGHLAVQFARHLGAEVVATAREPRHAWLKELGADEVIDYTRQPFEDVTGDIDIVIDLIGTLDDTDARSVSVTRPGGLVVAIPGGVSERLATVAAQAGVRTSPFLVEPDATALHTIAGLVDSGAVRVEVERTFALEEAAEAHRLGETNRTRGKLVLTVN